MPRTILLLAVTALVIAAPARAQNAPARLQVQPAKIDLVGAAAWHRVLVTAVSADGVRDVTGEATFTSQQPQIVTVGPGGECVPVGDGSATITVSHAGQSAQVAVTVQGAKEQRPPSFVNDIEPVLTRLGCNQGACHGKGSGQNGFRLSLRGYAPEWDHGWLTREFLNRRINFTVPEDSLLLRKPAGQAPHEGGVLMRPGSREYRTLLDWIRSGAPGLKKDEPAVKRIELLPGNRLLKAGQKQQLLVQAEFTDGRVKDVTWLTQFFSNDSAVAEVSPAGLVTLVRPGETAVRAHFLGQVAVAVLTAPHAAPVRPELFTQRNNFIDDHVFKKLADLRIEPSGPCDDATFIRRVYLDTIGTLPTPDEVRAFLADTSADKRAKLIDRVLERPEFADFWAMLTADLIQNRKERDHDVRGSKGVRALHQWLREQVAKNRPWDELAHELLTVTGDSDSHPAVGYYVVTVGEEREAHRSTIVASAAQTFLGTRIGCAQCHNHPLEKYTQDDYYHFAGFFSRVTLQRKEPKVGPTTLLVSHADKNQNKNPVGVNQPRTGTFLKAQPLDRAETKINPGDDPRQTLATWITNPKNESFAGAMVNRLWAHFFKTGLVEPVDDLRASNPPSNPELWNALVKEFVAHKFDRKHLMRVMLNSRAYQLASKTTPANEKDGRYYSHYYARRLPAEVLLDALCQATGVPERFDGYPVGVRAIQLPDPTVKSPFLEIFGRSERVTACACERQNEVNLSHTLSLSSSPHVLSRIEAGDGVLAELLKSKRSDAEIIGELFLRTFGRLPTAAENQAMQQARPANLDRRQYLQEVFWALLNARSFLFNH